MNNFISRRSIRMVGISFLILAFSVGAEDLKAQTVKPQLEPLKLYEGTWDSELQIFSDRAADPSQVIKGTVTGKWSVGGRVLEQTGRYVFSKDSQPLVIKTMMAYNKSTRRFDFYYFYSSGEVFEGVSTWSAEEKIMTTLCKDTSGKRSLEIIANFSKPNEESWLIVVKDTNNRTKMKIKGKNIRRKQP